MCTDTPPGGSNPSLVEACLIHGIYHSNLGRLAQSAEEDKGAIRFDPGPAGKFRALIPLRGRTQDLYG